MEIKPYTKKITVSYRDKIQIQVFSNSEQMHLLIVLDQDQLIKQVKQTKKKIG